MRHLRQHLLHLAAGAATLISTLGIATASASAIPAPVTFTGYQVSGGLTFPNEGTYAYPAISAFSGGINFNTNQVSGNVSFGATGVSLSSLPGTKFTMQLIPTQPITGREMTVGTFAALSAPIHANLLISALRFGSTNLKLSCETTTPIELPLTGVFPLATLSSAPLTFTGSLSAALPTFNTGALCDVLQGWLSGQTDTYTVTLSPPTA